MSKADFIFESPIFDDFRDKEIYEIARSFDEVFFKAGEKIFSEGAPGDALYIVASGKVKITKLSRKGEPKVLSSLAKNAIFGEMAILDNSPRSATATAETDTVLLKLERGEYESLVKLYKNAALKLLLKICRLLSLKLRKTSAEYSEVVERLQ